jgi:outer membrane lipoprotein
MNRLTILPAYVINGLRPHSKIFNAQYQGLNLGLLNLKGAHMNVLKTLWLVCLILFFITSCSVISQQIREESMAPVNFKILVQEADKYLGDTVILGGYILETQNLADKSSVKVLQVPLGLGENPKSKDDSKGRFIISYKGFLDPEIYSKDRKVTVAGTIVGTVVEKVDQFAQPYLKIESREIYLWPKEEEYLRPYYDPWYYPYPFFRHPYLYNPCCF